MFARTLMWMQHTRHILYNTTTHTYTHTAEKSLEFFNKAQNMVDKGGDF